MQFHNQLIDLSNLTLAEGILPCNYGRYSPYPSFFAINFSNPASAVSRTRFCTNGVQPRNTAHRPQRHPRPAPQIEAVLMPDNQAILKFKGGVNDVVDFAPGGKGVGRFPMGTAVPLIRLA